MFMLKRRFTVGLAAGALAFAGVGCSEDAEPVTDNPEVPSGAAADEAQGTTEGQPLDEGAVGEDIPDAEEPRVDPDEQVVPEE